MPKIHNCLFEIHLQLKSRHVHLSVFDLKLVIPSTRIQFMYSNFNAESWNKFDVKYRSPMYFWPLPIPLVHLNLLRMSNQISKPHVLLTLPSSPRACSPSTLRIFMLLRQYLRSWLTLEFCVLFSLRRTSEEITTFDRSSHFYERRDGTENYVRRTPSSAYHVVSPSESLRSRTRDRDRIYRNGPSHYTPILER